MSTNKELIEKTIETSDFLDGGQLNPEQQNKFVTLVRSFSNLLQQVRFERMTQAQREINKLHVGEPITFAAAENTPPSNQFKPKFNKVTLTAKKVASSWNITTEAFQENIEKDTFEDDLMAAATERIATDLELLAIQGDTSLTTNPTDPLINFLLSRLDGWDKLTDSAPKISANGNSISKSHFAAAKRALPRHYRSIAGLRYLMSDTIANDWLDTLADRLTVAGDNALSGTGIAPFGIPISQIPLIPDDKPVVPNGQPATSASVKGKEQGPFVIRTGSNDAVALKFDGAAGTVSVTLSQGTFTPDEIAQQIQSAITTAGQNGKAYADPDGHVVLESTTTGSTSSVEVVAAANDAYSTLGLTVGVTTGADASTGGTVNEGSFMWLTNPQNFIFGMVDNTRVFTEFNKDYDRVETVIYNQVAAEVENLEAVVKVTDIRQRSLV